MPTTEACSTCKFWLASPVGTSGECHRYPPVQCERDGDGTDHFEYPTTKPDGFCGEWVKKQTA